MGISGKGVCQLKEMLKIYKQNKIIQKETKQANLLRASKEQTNQVNQPTRQVSNIHFMSIFKKASCSLRCAEAVCNTLFAHGDIINLRERADWELIGFPTRQVLGFFDVYHLVYSNISTDATKHGFSRIMLPERFV